MSRIVTMPNGAGPDLIHTTILRQLGINVRPSFTRTRSGFYWCRLALPEQRFNRRSVCCPGETKLQALAHAIAQAERQRKAVA